MKKRRNEELSEFLISVFFLQKQPLFFVITFTHPHGRSIHTESHRASFKICGNGKFWYNLAHQKIKEDSYLSYLFQNKRKE